MFGGAVNGSKILGQYPATLIPASEQSTPGSRGIPIPTMPWEGLWQALAQWLGVADSSMRGVLPKMDNFDVDTLLTAERLFKHA